jgi:hypothetical protein
MSSIIIQHEESDARTRLEVTAMSRNNRQQGPTVTINAGRSARMELPEGGKLSIKEMVGQAPTAGSFNSVERDNSPMREGRESTPTRDADFESS